MDEFENQQVNETLVQDVEPKPPKDHKFGEGVVVGVLASIAVMLVGTLLGLAIYKNTAKPSGKTTGVIDQDTERKVEYITSILDKYYYEDPDVDELREGVYAGLVSGLHDPYSAYYSPEEYERLQISATGNYAGIGAVLQKDKDTDVIMISKIYPDSPAEKAGLQVGDYLISADGQLSTAMEPEEFASVVRGKKGTDVELVYERDNNQYTIFVTREEINVPSVSSRMLTDDIGYIQIGEFVVGTPDEFETAIQTLQSEGAKAFIFDVRDNPGGMVDSVTEMLDYILPEGTTLYMEEKDGTKTYYDSDAKRYLDAPMTVLTNGNSASASEIFAGAIHDFEAGTLIGTTTYGKGVVQVTIPLTDGSAVKVTIARYYTPSGVCIHGEGIAPDVELEYEYSGDLDADEYDYLSDNQVNKAIDILEEQLGE